MENKLKKRSINTVIYLLLGAMLVSIVGVSVFTVSSRRTVKDPVDSITQESTAAGGNSGTSRADTSGNTTDTASQAKRETGDSLREDASDTTAKDTARVTKNTTPAVTTQKEVPAAVELRYFVLPVVGSISKEFEIDIPVYSMTMNDYRAHTGVDVAAALGSDVVAASSGVICRIWNDPMMGYSLTVDHGEGIYTTYQNLADELASDIEVGAGVTMGQLIGAVGETALIEIAEEPHLHFEMKIDGAFVDPFDYISADAGADEAWEY